MSDASAEREEQDVDVKDASPVKVDMSGDRVARGIFGVFLAGPVIWLSHFLFVYAVVDAGCTAGGEGLRLLAPPVPEIVTILATVVAAAASLAAAAWALRWRRDAGGVGTEDEGDEDSTRDPDRSLAFGGFLLSLLSFVGVLFVGLPVLLLRSC